ncbi:MAG: GAF domain-containing protein, partial [Anaerolineae bacterium]
MLTGLGLGIGLLLLGLVLIVLVWAMLRVVPRPQAVSQANPLPIISEGHDGREEAVLLIRQGGRIDYINGLAREWFGLRQDEYPDLERLAQRARPADDFLSLCVAEGQERIAVNGQPVEVASYRVPGRDPSFLVTMRRLDVAAALQKEDRESATSLLKLLGDFGQAIASNLELQATLEAIAENISRLLPLDALEIKVWDSGQQRLIPYRYDALERRGKRVRREKTSRFEAYEHRLLGERQPLFIPDQDAALEESLLLDGGRSFPFRSYVGVPLLAGEELVGTLEVGSVRGGAFSQGDFDLLCLLSGQVGVAVRNALLYEAERRRTAELTSLAELAQAVASLREPEDLFRHLVQSIVSLFDVEIVGFLLYDEAQRVLRGQKPFQGLPPHVIEIYQTSVEVDSPAEKLLASQEMLLTEDAAEDPRWYDLGLQDIARAASLHDTALIPLQSGGRVLGYLQLSNHRQGPAPFSDEELRLAQIVANQAAAMIDNATLMQETRRRARRSEALRRIASLAASTATLDEVLGFAVPELARLLGADAGAVFLLDERQGVLRAHMPSLWGISPQEAEPLARLYVNDPQYAHTVSGSQRPFLSGHLSTDQRVLPLYRPLIETLQMESAVVVPLVARERSLGELMLASRERDFFSTDDLQMMMTAAGQLAAAIDEATLSAQTDENLRRRVEQLTALARVNRELSATLDLPQLLQVVYDESIRTTRADCGTIRLLESDEKGNEPRVLLSLGCPTGERLLPFELQAVRSDEALVISDFEESEYRPPHEGVRSALLVPIAYQGEVAGLIHLHSGQEAFFDETAVEITQILAVQAAIAIGNAQRYQEQQRRGELLRRRAETLAKLVEITGALTPDQPLESALASIAQAIRGATPFQVVLFSVYQPEDGMLRRVAGVGIPPETLAELRARRQPWQSVKQLLRPEFRIGRSYYIPHDRTPIIPSDVHVVTLLPSSPEELSSDSWHPEDFLLVPLEKPSGEPLGLLSVDAPRDGLRPDRATIEALEIFAAQAALVIDNHQRLNELNEQIEALNAGLKRQQQLLRVGQNDLPLLLRKDLEQTVAIQNLERRARRILAGLQITEAVGRQLDSSSALLALGREIITRLEMSAALIAESTPEGPHLLYMLGNVPQATNPEALFGQRNPLRTCLQTGETMLVMNLDTNDEWRDTPLLSALRARGFICLPITVEGKTIAAVLAVSSEPLPALTDEDQQIYLQIARHASVILQNINLLSETRRRLHEVNLLLDFSRRLSGLDTVGVVEALLESALRVIPAAHAGAVFLWDESRACLVAKAASGYADNSSMMAITYRPGEALPGSVFAEVRPLRVDEVNFARDYTLSAEALMRYRQATGGRLPVSSMLIPIQSGPQCLGVLVLDNFNTSAAFREEDEALLLSLSQQVGLSLQNVQLVQEARERAGQLQALTDVAAVITSRLQRDELIASLLDQLAPVLPFDTATLWLRDGERLVVAAASGFRDEDERIGLSVDIEDSALFQEMLRTGQGVVVDDVRQDERFPALAETLYLSWLGAPLVAKGEVIGVIALEKREAGFYTVEHLHLATAFAGQAAVALENAALYEESLRRAAELDQRSKRLALLNRFSAELSGLLNADEISRLTARELRDALGARRVSLVVFRGEVAVVSHMVPKRRGVKLPLVLPDTPLLNHVRQSLGVLTVEDVHDETDLIPLSEFLGAETIGLMIIPLVSGTTLHALLLAHFDREGRFSPTEIELARTIANQASIALESARLYQSTLTTAERLSILNQVSFEISTSLDPEQIYAAIHEAAKRLMPVESFVIALLDEEKQEIEGVYLVDHDQRFPNQRLPLGKGLSGKVIASGEPLLIHGPENVEKAGGVTYGALGTPQSILAVPMRLGEKVIGMLSAQSYQPGVYTEEDKQILSTFANQAAVAIQNGRLFAETQRLANELERRVIERTAALEREKRNTEILLGVLSEVTASLDLDRALNRTLALLNEAVGAEQGTIMLLDVEDGKLHYRAGYGYMTRSGKRDEEMALQIGEGLGGWVVQHGEGVLIGDVMKDPRWLKSSSKTQQHRSAIATPLMVGEEVVGVLMVFHRKPNFFTEEQFHLVNAIASQVAVAINNAKLYSLISEQAERLGSLVREGQETSSRLQAILEAVADGVLVTDAGNRISFINSSAQRILNVRAESVLGQSLDDFAGFFGKAASTWMETIRFWSEDPTSYQEGDTY